MSLTNYADLEAAVANWLKRSDLTANIPDFITLAEAQMNRDFMGMNPPLRAMENTQTGNLSTTSSPPALLALPSGYLGTKRFQIQESGYYRALKYKPPEEMAVYSVNDRPEYYTLNGENLELGAPPDTTYAYAWTYYKGFAALSGGVNWVITNAPDIYLYCTLLQAEPFLKNDKRILVWAQFYQNALDKLEIANRVDRQSGSTLQMRSDVAF